MTQHPLHTALRSCHVTRIALWEDAGGSRVSTVNIKVGNYTPLYCYETATCIAGKKPIIQERYTNVEDAVKGHMKWVEAMRKTLATEETIKTRDVMVRHHLPMVTERTKTSMPSFQGGMEESQ